MAKSNSSKSRPALSPEAQENRMISLSMSLAEKQLVEGTASSQVITHFLKLGSIKAQTELEKLKKETALLEAKKEAIESSARVEELYNNAITAMRSYSGMGGQEDD